MSCIPDSQDERRLRLLNALPAIAWSASARTFCFNYINPAAEKILGYPVERWLEEPDFWASHIHPDDRHVARLCHNETLACRDHELVYRMIAADGRTVWLRDYVNVYSVDGKAVELFGVMVDITRERAAEEAWNQSQENFQRMVEASPDCIGVHVDGVYVYVNQAFVQLLGAKSEDEIVGRDLFSFIDVVDHDRVRRRLKRVAAGETVPYERKKYRRIDGSLVDVEVAALPLRYGNGNAVQVIARDITERVRAEEELQVREARLQLLASGTHEAIWEWFPDRRELWTNDAYREMVGTPSDPNAFFDDWLARVHPDDREAARLAVRDAIEGKAAIWWHEYRLRRADGTYGIVLDRGHAARSSRGELRVIGALVDVTTLRDAERMRATAEAKFRWLVEQSVVAVYMMSGGRLTYINETGARMLGYTPDELTALDLSTLFEGDDRPETVFGGGPNVTRVRRRDGSLLHVAFYPNEVVIDGETTIIGTGADVTESVHARQALEASEQRYRELVDGVGDILYTADEDGRFLSLSRGFERCTGYRADDWVGRPFAELFRPCAAADELRHAPILEYELQAQSGLTLTVEVSSQPRYVDGILAGTIGMIRDVTESRNVARKLEESKRMSSLGQVAASLAHEFNNVLMGIQPFVEVIARQAAGATGVAEALGHITRAVNRGKRASQEILRFANPKEPQLFAIETRTWLPSFLGQLTAGLPETIAFSSSIAPGIGSIRGDREHLEQVITNLVFNARDALGGSGRIDVDVSRSGRTAGTADEDFVCIAVGDDGPGIPPAMLDQIFEPLFTTKRNGTGLGLAIARRLMERQGGALTVESRPGGGSVFRAFVPVAEGAAPHTQRDSAVAPAVRRILLVEDDVAAGAGLEALLRMEGFETTWVCAAAEACEMARRVQPEVAVIDVNLPDGSGIDLIPLLRAEHEDLPIVLSTGHVELNIADEEKRLLSLMKPYELPELLAAIGTVTSMV